MFDLFQRFEIFRYTVGRFIRQVNSRNAILWGYAIQLGGKFWRIISKTLPDTTTNHVIFEALRTTSSPRRGPPFSGRWPFTLRASRQKGRGPRPRPPSARACARYFDVVFWVVSAFTTPRLRKTWIEPSRCANAVFPADSYITITSGSPSLFTSATKRS